MNASEARWEVENSAARTKLIANKIIQKAVKKILRRIEKKAKNGQTMIKWTDYNSPIYIGRRILSKEPHKTILLSRLQDVLNNLGYNTDIDIEKYHRAVVTGTISWE